MTETQVNGSRVKSDLLHVIEAPTGCSTNYSPALDTEGNGHAFIQNT